MRKPSCVVTRRVKKKESEGHARKRIGDFLRRTGKVLGLVCTKSGECLSFGRKIDEITGLFKGFTGFQYVENPVTTLGKPSNNGFVKEIKYMRNGYAAHAVLKSCLTSTSDNLVYEYLVGVKFINRIIKQFPCFLQTYGLFYHTIEDHYTELQDNKTNDKSYLNSLALQTKVDFAKACREPENACILIQHINSAKPIADYLKSYNPTVKYALTYILFIIYHALASLRKTFTHYDLHDSNVLIIEPNSNKFIHYKYHMSDGQIVEFFCPYIPKIIDYGRSFFDNGNTNSKKIYDKICQTVQCTDCGDQMGFQWLDTIPYLGISSQKKNESHDLRLLYTIYDELRGISGSKPTNFVYKETVNMMKRVIYGEGINVPADKKYGTEENLTRHPSGNLIANVTDAYERLKSIITHPDAIYENNQMFNDPNDIYGIFHIYEDGRSMVFDQT
jgi:hypothetical protein